MRDVFRLDWRVIFHTVQRSNSEWLGSHTSVLPRNHPDMDIRDHTWKDTSLHGVTAFTTFHCTCLVYLFESWQENGILNRNGPTQYAVSSQMENRPRLELVPLRRCSSGHCTASLLEHQFFTFVLTVSGNQRDCFNLCLCTALPGSISATDVI